jgi:hypothetical protein
VVEADMMGRLASILANGGSVLSRDISGIKS